ncbi:MAG: hypothetical protein JO027_09190 [Solirubrobacterales bacterium]|nr:hypothetical protein [Solirubrobacterales bacterium]
MSVGTSAASSARVRSAVALGAALAAFGSVVSGAAADSPASASAPCGTNFDPYSYTASALNSCGLSTSVSAVTSALPGGGSETAYTLPGGQGVTTLYSPPAGFDPATASSAQLEEYGFAVPSTSDGLLALESWQGAMSQLTKSAPNPPFLAVGGASAGGELPGAGAYPGTSGNWSGYQANTGGFAFSYASWKEPTYGGSRCSSNSAVVWDGIGGANGDPYLGQDGTAHGQGNDQPGGANHQMWEEVLPQQKSLVPLPVIGAAGHEMYANTSWYASKHEYTGTVGDITSNSYKNWSHAGNWSSSDTAEAIVERPSYNNQLRDLSNFQTMSFTTSGGNSTPMNDFSKAQRTGLEMVDGAGNDMANVGGVGSNGSFSDTQHSCS